MPKKQSAKQIGNKRSSPEKDSNGGKLGQFTTEVAETIRKAKEESAAFFMEELRNREAAYKSSINEIRTASRHKTYFDAVVHTSLFWAVLVICLWILV